VQLPHFPSGAVTTAEREAQVLALADAGKLKLKPHALAKLLAKLALDLVHYAYGRNEPPPAKLLRRALALSADHTIGFGRSTPACTMTAPDEMEKLAERLCNVGQGTAPPLSASRIKGELGREIQRKTLRNWRREDDYWTHYWDEPPPRSKRT